LLLSGTRRESELPLGHIGGDLSIEGIQIGGRLGIGFAGAEYLRVSVDESLLSDGLDRNAIGACREQRCHRCCQNRKVDRPHAVSFDHAMTRGEEL
jgi:hypothetical protein